MANVNNNNNNNNTQSEKNKNQMFYDLQSPWTKTEYTFMIQGLNTRTVQIHHLAKAVNFDTQDLINCMEHLVEVPVTVISSAKKGKFDFKHLGTVLKRIGWSQAKIDKGLPMLSYEKGSKEKIGKDHPREPNITIPLAWLKNSNTNPKSGDDEVSSSISNKADSTEGGGGDATKKRQVVIAASPKKVVEIEESSEDDLINYINKYGGPNGYNKWVSDEEGIAYRNYTIQRAVFNREDDANRDALIDIDNAVLAYLYAEFEKERNSINARSINKRF
jgi:hypothetical protein